MKRTIFAAAIAVIAATAAQAQVKDSLALGMALEPPHLDPTAGAAAAIREVTYANLFESLTRIERTGAVKPWLAKSWTISPDGLVYSFALVEGARFHDGAPFDSGVAKFALDRAAAPDSTNAQKQLFRPIAKVEAPDAKTLVVTLKQPTSLFLYYMGWPDAAMVSPATAADNKAKPIGTGPFKFKESIKGDRVTLERNDAYWGPRPALKTVTFKFISDPTAQVNALLAGDIDAFPNLGAPEQLGRLGADARFMVKVGTTEGETILAMNNGKAPLSDIRVRRAIAHAIDRKAIIDGAMFGLGVPIGTHFSPAHPAYLDLTGRYAHDPAKAKALLAEAGLANGFKATLKLPPPAYARRGGEIVAAQLAKIGIQAEIVPLEWAAWLTQVFRTKDYDLTIVSHTEPMDIEIYGRDDYYFAYDNAAMKAIMARFEKAMTPAEQTDLLRQAQRRIAEDAVNVFMFQLPKAGVWNAKLSGLWENSPIPANDLTEVAWRP